MAVFWTVTPVSVPLAAFTTIGVTGLMFVAFAGSIDTVTAAAWLEPAGPAVPLFELPELPEVQAGRKSATASSPAAIGALREKSKVFLTVMWSLFGKMVGEQAKLPRRIDAPAPGLLYRSGPDHRVFRGLTRS
ncbi:hypothetical protein [Amycolatopsis thermalba]|uniref:hypothetical protein n=1 Tax=Amycolatopsis thermalba TaxID=944492 RepID=UPI003B84B5B1